MDYAPIFTSLLHSSTEALLWSVQQIPEDKYYAVSPRRPESWPVARLIMHIQYNEEQVVLPCMRLWLNSEQAAPNKIEDKKRIERYTDYEMLVHDEENTWAQAPDMGTRLEKFRTGRQEQLALLAQFSPTAWEETRTTVWGQVTLRWTLTKTYQHTLEHNNDILKHALYSIGLRLATDL